MQQMWEPVFDVIGPLNGTEHIITSDVAKAWPVADNDHLVGALVVTTPVIAMAEVARPLRFLSIAFGLWLVIAPWIVPDGTAMADISGGVAGLALIGLSLPRGPRSQEHYGNWDRHIV